MVDSALVLKGQTIAYTCYTIVIMLVMAWFALRITRPGKSKVKVNPDDQFAKVEKIFKDRCLKCHGSEKQEGDYRLECYR